ncbi:hypothetical protein ABPG77_002123 [Micractinium sp. CCAP 211/92]
MVSHMHFLRSADLISACPLHCGKHGTQACPSGAREAVHVFSLSNHPNRLLQLVGGSLTGCFQNCLEHQAAAAVAPAVEAAIVLHARNPSHLVRHSPLLYYSSPDIFEESAFNGNV